MATDTDSTTVSPSRHQVLPDPLSLSRNGGAAANKDNVNPRIARLTHMTRIGIITGLTLLPLAATIGFASSAQAVDNGTLGIHPATESDFFHLSVAPGSTLNETAVVNNYTAAPITLLTYVADGLTTPQGTFALNNMDSVPVSVGLWSTLETKTITIPAQSELEVPFTIAVPATTTPGDYIGGLIIQEPLETGQVSTTAAGTPMRMDVIHRQGVRIYLNVSGTPITTLTAGDLNWTQSGDTVHVTLPITNTGNTTLHPTAVAKISSIIGMNTSTAFTTPESITPGSTVILNAEISPAAFIQLGQIAATVSSEAPALQTSTQFVEIPWWILGVFFAALITAVSVATWLVRRQIRFTRKAKAAIARIEREDQATSETEIHA